MRRENPSSVNADISGCPGLHHDPKDKSAQQNWKGEEQRKNLPEKSKGPEKRNQRCGPKDKLESKMSRLQAQKREYRIRDAERKKDVCSNQMQYTGSKNHNRKVK